MTDIDKIIRDIRERHIQSMLEKDLERDGLEMPKELKDFFNQERTLPDYLRPRQLVRLRVNSGLLREFEDLVRENDKNFSRETTLLPVEGHEYYAHDLIFDNKDMREMKNLFAQTNIAEKDISDSIFTEQTKPMSQYQMVDMYQVEPGVLAGVVRLNGERVHFSYDEDFNVVKFDPKDLARLEKEGLVQDMETIARVEARQFSRDALNQVREVNDIDRIKELMQIPERDTSTPMGRMLEERDVQVAYQTVARAYMQDMRMHDTVRDRENVMKLLYAVSLMERGLADKDERCMAEGFNIAGDALSAITHSDVTLSKNAATMQMVRDMAIHLGDDVKQHIEEGNPEKDTHTVDIATSVLKEHGFFDEADGSRTHEEKTTTRKQSMEISR